MVSYLADGSYSNTDYQAGRATTNPLLSTDLYFDLQEFLSLDDAKYPTVTLCLEVVSAVVSQYVLVLTDFTQEPYKQDDFLAFNITQYQYTNPNLYNYKNLSHLYTIPYDDISLSFNDENFKLETLISLRNKTHLFNKFKFRGKFFGLDIS